MENKKRESKIRLRQDELIEKNIKVMELLYFIFRGQVLDMDLKELCLVLKICSTEGQYRNIIKNLVNGDIVKTTKLVRTENKVIVAKAPVYRYFEQIRKTTKYSVEVVTRNSYMSYILQKRLTILEDEDIEELAERLKNKTTLLAKKRDVLACYQPFMERLTDSGLEAYKDALYNEQKRKKSLKKGEQKSGEPEEELEHRGIAYKETLQTLVERDIYVIRTKQGGYKVAMTDNNSEFVFSNLIKKIALIVKIFGLQIEEQEQIDIVVYVKSEASKKRIENNFILKYAGGIKVNLDTAINEAIKDYNYPIEYKYDGKTETDVHVLINELGTKFKKMKIRIENTNIAYKHNSDLKAQALAEYQREQKEKRQAKKLMEELRKQGVLIEKPKKKNSEKEVKEDEELDNV